MTLHLHLHNTFLFFIFYFFFKFKPNFQLLRYTPSICSLLSQLSIERPTNPPLVARIVPNFSMFFKSTDLPRYPAQWNVAQRSLKAETIHSLGKLDSASDIQKPQFLLLRAVWHIKRQTEFEIKDWFQEAYIKDAVSFLDDYSDWKNYLESFSQDIKLAQRPFPSLGAFTLVKYSQLEVQAAKGKTSSVSVMVSPIKTRSMTAREEYQNVTPSKAPANRQKIPNVEYGDSDDDNDDGNKPNLSPWTPAKKSEQTVLYPPTEDEQIVNAALLNFLTLVTIAHPDVCLRWCLGRKAVQFVCEAENSGAVGYEARTDGYLRGMSYPSAYAIVEVKPYVRANKVHTRWQETAQMAAWIWEDPSLQSEKFQ